MILITGGNGFLGQALVDRLLKRGQKVICLSRREPPPKEGQTWLAGDILKPDLGLDGTRTALEGITAVYHLAARHDLGEDKDGMIWFTNVDGTDNVVRFCTKFKVPHLYFCSTAFTIGHNTYESSKISCENLVIAADIPEKTIFKPSIIMGSPDQHFSRFVSVLIRFHRRAEIIRRRFEGTLRVLPPIEPLCRLRGNPDAHLNLIDVEDVAEAMATITKPGTFWLTNPRPASLRQITEWVGDYIMIDLRVMPEFKPSLIESAVARATRAFAPYLFGDSFPSSLAKPRPMDRTAVESLIKALLLKPTQPLT